MASAFGFNSINTSRTSSRAMYALTQFMISSLYVSGSTFLSRAIQWLEHTMRNVRGMRIISLLNEGAQAGAQALGAFIAFGAFASLGELGVFSVFGTFDLLAALGLLALFSALGEFGAGGACGVFRAFGLLDAFDVFGALGMFGSIGAFSACGLLGVLSAFGRFGLCPPRSACLVRLARTSCSARSGFCPCFGRSPCSVCGVGVHVRVGVAVGGGVGVGVAVDFYVGVAIFFASRVNIGMRVDMFVCFGRLRLWFVGARGRVRTRSPHIHFYIKNKNE